MRKFVSLMLVAMLACAAFTAPAMAAQYTAGTYTAKADGNNGPVEVSVTVSDDAIVSVEIVSHAETAGIADRPIEEIPTTIVENQSLAVDAISGATNTSNAILAAVEDCIVQAGGDVDALKAVSVEQAPAEDVEATYDVVICGGGGAGLSAALAARESGASVRF